MKRFLHRVWPSLAVVALSAVLALQIPRKALFFTPVAPAEVKPFASFVTYDDEAYASILQKTRMSWQVRGAMGRTRESHVDAFDFIEELPAMQPLGLPHEFERIEAPTFVTSSPMPLLPPSFADANELVPIAVSPEGDIGKYRRSAELLEIPESIKTTE